MKRWLICLGLLCVPIVTTAQSYDFDFDLGYDEITNYEVDITVQPDSTILVRETISYDFGYPGHGITRYIPYTYTRYGLLQDNLDITLLGLSVNGAAVPYETNRADGILEWRIGDPNRTVEDEQT